MDIMPPDNQLPPHHAPTGLKLWLAVFAVVLVVALGYLVWASNTAPDTTNNSATVTKKTTAIETVTLQESGDISTASWKTFSTGDGKFSVKYPADWLAQPAGTEKTLNEIVDSAGIVSIFHNFISSGQDATSTAQITITYSKSLTTFSTSAQMDTAVKDSSVEQKMKKVMYGDYLGLSRTFADSGENGITLYKKIGNGFIKIEWQADPNKETDAVGRVLLPIIDTVSINP